MLGVFTGFLRGRLVPRTGLSQLTGKRGNKNYYKGKGCRTMGRHTRKGKYILMEEKMPDYMVPDLLGFKLQPYVSHEQPKIPPKAQKAST